MEIRYFEDKTPRIIYGTLDSVWINKAIQMHIVLCLRKITGLLVTIPLYTEDNIILPHYMVTRHYDCDAR